MSQDSQSQEAASSQSEEEIKKAKLKKSLIIISPGQAPTANARITINLALCHYDVIEQVAQQLGWRVQRSINPGVAWDILWTDHHIQPDFLIRMQLYQKVSHFPGIHVLSRKNLLGLSFMDMAKRAPDQYNFFPKTWLLPAQYSELRKQITEQQKTFIVKPEADCQGRGIFLMQTIEQVQNGKHYVVQEYISRPLLVDSLKFDFRVYVLLCGVSPMRIYIYEEGLARFATEPYVAPNKHNLKKQFMHLTNYAINKKNPKYIFNSNSQRMDVGHKRALTSVLRLVQKRGFNLQQVKQDIHQVIVKTLLLGHPLVAHQYRFCQPNDQQRNMCFHLLGIDVMLDAECKPFILQVNHTPSFVTDTPLDYHIKYALIKDTLLLMNITPSARQQALDRIQVIKKQRNLKRQKRQLYQNIDKQQKVKAAQEQRDRFQDKNLGNFTRIYPVPNKQKMRVYEQLLELAEKAYFSENNVLRAQMQKQKAMEQSVCKDKQQKQKKMTQEEMSSSPKLYKGFSTISQEIDKNSQDSPFKLAKRDRIGSFVQGKSKFKQTAFLQLKQIEKQLIPFKAKGDLISSTKPSPCIVIKQNNPKTLPKIKNDHVSTNNNSPLRNQQNSYVAYRKKKIALMKLKDEQRQAQNNAQDHKNVKEIIIASRTRNCRKQKEQGQSSEQQN